LKKQSNAPGCIGVCRACALPESVWKESRCPKIALLKNLRCPKTAWLKWNAFAGSLGQKSRETSIAADCRSPAA
jgi:hypothetical protein